MPRAVILAPLILIVLPCLCIADVPSKESIDRAVNLAVKALRTTQEPTGMWTFELDQPEKNVGATALAGLALLEAGVPANDPAVVKAATIVRAASTRLTETYAQSLAVLFLDRFGGGREAETIRTVAGKLAAGHFDGGWSYKAIVAPTPADPNLGGAAPDIVPADNSNTQFAVLALWVARKHRAPVEAALKAADTRFRRTQRADGSWGYGTTTDPGQDRSMPTMTCAGMLALAVGYGSSANKPDYLNTTSRGVRDIADDPAIVSALAFLTTHVGNEPMDHPQWMYYLWSLSRVCVALKVPTIGQHDWYEWGANRLINSQFADGSWKTKYGTAIDTSMAIMFLKKTDLLGDIRAAGPAVVTTEKKPMPGVTGEEAKKPAAERPAPAAPEIDNSPRLTVKLVRATASQQPALIAEYRDAKGVEYTLALAAAIPDLGAEAQEKAREALAARLSRMSLRTLRSYMEDSDRELRRAAAAASEAKRLGDAVPDLIRLLRDKDENVVNAAHAALKRITKQNFDRTPGPWEAWWRAREDQ